MQDQRRHDSNGCIEHFEIQVFRLPCFQLDGLGFLDELAVASYLSADFIAVSETGFQTM